MNKKYIQLGIALALIFLSSYLWYSMLASSSPQLTVSFLDIGQGDAIFIQSPTGKQVLIDAGPDTSVLRQLGKEMPWYDKSIDMVIETHPDKDHIGGFPLILDRYHIDYFVDPGAKNENGVQDVLDAKVKEQNITRILGRRGEVFDLGDGVTLSVLYPDHDVSKVPSNDGSMVMRLTYGDTSFILTGDAPKETEEKILSKDSSIISAQVLKLGHHGSESSTAASFLQAVHPTYAVVSAGVNNRYGHPHQAVIDLVKKFGITIVSTQKSGTIRFHSDGTTVVTDATPL